MTKASQQEEKQGVTYADLDRAADAALAGEQEPAAETEEAVEEIETSEEETIEEAEDDSTEEEEETEEVAEEEVVEKQHDAENAERSKLGRKVKSLEDQITRLTFLLESKEAETSTKEEVDEDDDAFITASELPKYLEKHTKRKEQEQVKYQQGYVSAFSAIGKDDEAFNDIWEEMLERHNTIVTGDPKVDAQINYFKAKAALYESKKPVNPVMGKGKTAKTKTNIPEQIKEKTPKPVKLDPIAEEFVRKQGLSKEFVEKTFSK